MTDCKLCRKGDPAFNIRCSKCREVFHIHKRQLDLANDGEIVMADCPTCSAKNCWQKRHGKIAYSGPVVYYGQRVVDLRGASGSTRASRRGAGRGDQRSLG